jgi:hypothetical protein
VLDEVLTDRLSGTGRGGEIGLAVAIMEEEEGKAGGEEERWDRQMERK